MTLAEAKMCTFTLESTHFIFNKCPIYTAQVPNLELTHKKRITVQLCAAEPFWLKNLRTPDKHCCKISGKYTNIFAKSSFIYYFEQLFLAQIEKKHDRCNSAVYTSQSNISLVVFTPNMNVRRTCTLYELPSYLFNDALLQDQKILRNANFFLSLKFV